MDEFCTSCGTALKEEAKFCVKCGAQASPASEEVRTLPDQVAPNGETVLSKVGKRSMISLLVELSLP